MSYALTLKITDGQAVARLLLILLITADIQCLLLMLKDQIAAKHETFVLHWPAIRKFLNVFTSIKFAFLQLDTKLELFCFQFPMKTSPNNRLSFGIRQIRHFLHPVLKH